MRGHGSDLAAQVGPQRGVCGQGGLGGGTMLAQEGGSGDLKPGSQAGQTRCIWWDLPEELVTLSLRPSHRGKSFR